MVMTTTPVVTTPAPASVPTPSPGALPGRSRQRGPRRSAWSWLRRAASPIALVVLWQLLSSAGVIGERTLASPYTIVTTALDLIKDGTLGEATLVSLQRAGIGFAVGFAAAVVLAVVAGLWRIGDDVVDPPMQMLRTLPLFGLIPLFIIWFGIGELPKVLLVAIGVVFPVYLNTVAGIRGIDRKVLEAARSMNLTWAQRLRHVVLPGALPSALTGLRQALGIAWLALVVAETISAKSGLGYLINDAREFLQTDVIVVGLAVYAVLGLVTDAVVRAIERKALAWRV
jgi:sulfonate transport system permease protein